jgi:hypothetical protein
MLRRKSSSLFPFTECSHHLVTALYCRISQCRTKPAAGTSDQPNFAHDDLIVFKRFVDGEGAMVNKGRKTAYANNTFN